jgi:hypothetical protein
MTVIPLVLSLPTLQIHPSNHRRKTEHNLCHFPGICQFQMPKIPVDPDTITQGQTNRTGYWTFLARKQRLPRFLGQLFYLLHSRRRFTCRATDARNQGENHLSAHAWAAIKSCIVYASALSLFTGQRRKPFQLWSVRPSNTLNEMLE